MNACAEQATEPTREEIRDVVLGSGSKVWATLSQRTELVQRFRHAIGHRELKTFEFHATDRVWVLSYSRIADENRAILHELQRAGVQQVVYVSSSSTVVTQVTRCYEYPRVKLVAEQQALELSQSKVLTIGLMYEDEQELPSGDNIATCYRELAAFMLAPDWPEAAGRRKRLFQVISRPFHGSIEPALHGLYGRLMSFAGGRPCLLRPFDLVLRMLQFRWYGYVFLSNRLWISTMS